MSSDVLTGPAAGEVLQAALSGAPGRSVPGFTYAFSSVHERVGAETSVVYDVGYDGLVDDASSDDVGYDADSRAVEQLVATTADVDGAVAVEVGDQRVHVWRHPCDPRLPGLTGAIATGAELLVYRPLRRAVLRSRSGPTTFTKVVRPDAGHLLDRRHTLLNGLGPDVIARPEPGVIVTAEVPGTSLAVALSAWQLGESTAAPSPDHALALLDSLPPEVADLPARPSWTDRIDFHADMAAAHLPGRADELRRLAAEVAELTKTHPAGPVVPTHGDFHVGNIFCVDALPSRVIDVDTVGPGRRVDDLACLVAHLAVLPSLSPAHYPRGAEVAEEWASAFELTVHPGALRARVAGVLVSLIHGSAPELAQARLDLALDWAARAHATTHA